MAAAQTSTANYDNRPSAIDSDYGISSAAMTTTTSSGKPANHGHASKSYAPRVFGGSSVSLSQSYPGVAPPSPRSGKPLLADADALSQSHDAAVSLPRMGIAAAMTIQLYHDGRYALSLSPGAANFAQRFQLLLCERPQELLDQITQQAMKRQVYHHHPEDKGYGAHPDADRSCPENTGGLAAFSQYRDVRNDNHTSFTESISSMPTVNRDDNDDTVTVVDGIDVDCIRPRSPEQQRDHLAIDDDDALKSWAMDRFDKIQQIPCKDIARQWILMIDPMKRKTHPYSAKGKRKRKSYLLEKGGKPTPPPWWPNDVQYLTGPDHLKKTDLTKLLTHLLFLPRFMPELSMKLSQPKEGEEGYGGPTAFRWVELLKGITKTRNLRSYKPVVPDKVDYQTKVNKARHEALDEMFRVARDVEHGLEMHGAYYAVASLPEMLRRQQTATSSAKPRRRKSLHADQSLLVEDDSEDANMKDSEDTDTEPEEVPKIKKLHLNVDRTQCEQQNTEGIGASPSSAVKHEPIHKAPDARSRDQAGEIATTREMPQYTVAKVDVQTSGDLCGSNRGINLPHIDEAPFHHHHHHHITRLEGSVNSPAILQSHPSELACPSRYLRMNGYMDFGNMNTVEGLHYDALGNMMLAPPQTSMHQGGQCFDSQGRKYEGALAALTTRQHDSHSFRESQDDHRMIGYDLPDVQTMHYPNQALMQPSHMMWTPALHFEGQNFPYPLDSNHL